MKEKFKIVCINNKPINKVNGNAQNLTVGRVYETYDQLDMNLIGVSINNDIGNEVNYSSSRFLTLEEWRERKLKEILDDEI